MRVHWIILIFGIFHNKALAESTEAEENEEVQEEIKEENAVDEDFTDSFSFHKFRGPVSGELREITYQIPEGSTKIDYEARPDYAYTYGVHDKDTGNSHTHVEARDGDETHGEYRVLQPDGLVRIVRYTSDPKEGFKATIEYAKM